MSIEDFVCQNVVKSNIRSVMQINSFVINQLLRIKFWNFYFFIFHLIFDQYWKLNKVDFMK